MQRQMTQLFVTIFLLCLGACHLNVADKVLLTVCMFTHLECVCWNADGGAGSPLQWTSIGNSYANEPLE